jgi:hypothetical protein
VHYAGTVGRGRIGARDSSVLPLATFADQKSRRVVGANHGALGLRPSESAGNPGAVRRCSAGHGVRARPIASAASAIGAGARALPRPAPRRDDNQRKNCRTQVAQHFGPGHGRLAKRRNCAHSLDEIAHGSAPSPRDSGPTSSKRRALSRFLTVVETLDDGCEACADELSEVIKIATAHTLGP